MKKDEKDAGSRRWNALISLASFDLGCFALNLRSRDCSWRVGGPAPASRTFGPGAGRSSSILRLWHARDSQSLWKACVRGFCGRYKSGTFRWRASGVSARPVFSSAQSN